MWKFNDSFIQFMKDKLILFILFFSLLSCGKEEEDLQQPVKQQVSPPVVESRKEEPQVKYVYKGAKGRDLFTPLAGKSAQFAKEEATETLEMSGSTLSTLSLKGFVRDVNQKYALINDTGGGRYVVKGGKVFDRRGKQIQGVVGIVKEKSVILITSDKTIRELKMGIEEEK